MNVNVGSIGEYIREQREQAKISLRQLASAAGVSNPYLSQIERGLRRPSAEILQQIAKGLRISAEALYIQAGILEERKPDSGVRAAVLADPDLAERQKQVLLEIYESFRREMAVTTGADFEPDLSGPQGRVPADEPVLPGEEILAGEPAGGGQPEVTEPAVGEVPVNGEPTASGEPVNGERSGGETARRGGARRRPGTRRP